MGWIFDIAVVVLVIIAAVIGAKKGFFRACFDFCGALIAMIAAGLLSVSKQFDTPLKNASIFERGCRLSRALTPFAHSKV